MALALPTAGAATLRVAAQSMPLFQGIPYPPVSLPQAVFAQMIFDPLTQAGANGVVEPSLAISWTQEAPNTWVFKLRPGVTFSNGERFDATAVTEALSFLSTPQGQRDSIASQDIGKTVASFRARDPLTVEIVTKTSDPILPLHLSFLRVPAPAAWRERGREGFLTQPIGTGPFMVTKWSESGVSLSANRTSWRAPLLDGIEVRIVPDPVGRIQAFASDAVDIALTVGPDDGQAVQERGGRLAPRAAPNVHFVAFVTTKTSPLQNLQVRRALNYAVDKSSLINAFLNGATSPAGQISHPGAFGFDPALQPYPYDPAKAKALLAEAGYAGGFAFTTVIDASAGGNYTGWYQQVAQYLAAVGVHMTVRAAPTAQITEYVLGGKWPVEAFGWTFAGFDSLRGYRFRSCEMKPAYNCDPDLMPIIAAAENATTEATRRTATQAVLAAERDRPPGIILWQKVDFDALSKRVGGFSVVNDRIAWDKISLSPK